jgi:hypothetical protein
MNCRRMEQMLIGGVQLSAVERVAYDRHLAECASCRGFARSLEVNREALQPLTEVRSETGRTARAAEVFRTEREAQPIRARVWGRPQMALAGFAAAACVAALLALRKVPTPTGKTGETPSQVAVATRQNPPAGKGGVVHQAAPAAGDRQRGQPVIASREIASTVPGSPDVRGQQPVSPTPPAAVEDGQYLNPDGVTVLASWSNYPPSAVAKAQAWIDRTVKSGDNFVQVPFPRLAGAGRGALRAAAREYQKEKEVVDARLVRTVTIGVKGMAFSDLCKKVTDETGIELKAGRSAADDKVTLFCKNKPLRDLMRQINLVFGFHWLRSGEPGAYRYELMQDLRSQLMEEELRNKDRNEALIAMDQEMERFRKYLGMSPDELRSKAETASPEDKQLLEKLAGEGWAAAQIYSQLSPDQMNALRSGEALNFGAWPRDNQTPVPPGLEQGVLSSLNDARIKFDEQGLPSTGSREEFPDGVPPSQVPQSKPIARLKLEQNELGRVALVGGAGFTISDPSGKRTNTSIYDSPLAVSESPSIKSPKNAQLHAKLATDPVLQKRVTIRPEASCKLGPHPYLIVRDGPPPPTGEMATTADVLEALHKVTGADVVGDYYTRLYAPGDVTAKETTLLDALNKLSDKMRMTWKRVDGWYQFRTAGFFNERLKEVPHRLLARWQAVRKEKGALGADDVAEMAACTDAQLDGQWMAQGVRAIYGLPEWEIVRPRNLRKHWRFLAALSPAQRQSALDKAGLNLSQITPSQQQALITYVASKSDLALKLTDIMAGTLKLRLDPNAPPNPDYLKSGRNGGQAVEFAYSFTMGPGRRLEWGITPEGDTRTANTTEEKPGPAGER